MKFFRLSVEEARQLMLDGEITVLDIRDENAYAQGHLPNAIHVKDINIDTFVTTSDKENPLLIYCYHGSSSIPAAAYFADKGFTKTYSMDGGFEAWHARVNLP